MLPASLVVVHAGGAGPRRSPLVPIRASAASPARGGPPEVLIVDDDRDVREVVQATLEAGGYRVRTAADGLAGLIALGEHRPDVIILDLWMPVVHGWAFRSRQMRTPAWRDIPVVILTATENLSPRSVDLAPAAVLSKPFHVADLIAAVDRLVRVS